MNVLLICPAERSAIRLLTATMPLVNVPIFGKSLMEYWIEHVVGQGATHIRVLAADRPEQVRAQIGDGARWGVNIEVIPMREELTVVKGRQDYQTTDETKWLHGPNDVSLLDHLPGQSQGAMCESYAGWFQGLLAWMPLAPASVRIGLRQIQPGVWAGLRTRVSPGAQLIAPCWLGESVTIGPQAVVGPMAILEDKVVVEAAAEISHSLVGAETFVGECTELKDSLAFGDILINWKTNSSVRVRDAFLLCSLGQRRLIVQPASWLGRLAALGLLVGTSPLGLFAILMAKFGAQPAFKLREAVRPLASESPGETFRYYELSHSNRWLRRWPQLWNIADGTFAWVGNRPLSQAEAESLDNDFERLWLSAPIGLISLADAEGCDEPVGDEARAHASFYAVQANARLDLAILQRALLAGLSLRRPDSVRPLLASDQTIWKGIKNENTPARKYIAYQRT